MAVLDPMTVPTSAREGTKVLTQLTRGGHAAGGADGGGLWWFMVVYGGLRSFHELWSPQFVWCQLVNLGEKANHGDGIYERLEMAQ